MQFSLCCQRDDKSPVFFGRILTSAQEFVRRMPTSFFIKNNKIRCFPLTNV